MELNRTNNWFYLSVGLATGFILILGAWWLFLVFKLAAKLNSAEIPNLEGNLISMVKWEGFTFFILLIGLGSALLYFFFQDHKKTKSLHSFFASLTHELKTPLASIRLQSQVMDENINELNVTDEEKDKIKKYSSRLLQDTIRLEDQLDKHLQLSRLEKDQYLQREELNIKSFIIREYSKLSLEAPNLELLDGATIYANPFTVSLIFKNLIENTQRHNPTSSGAVFNYSENQKTISVTYNDNGNPFVGDPSKLGQLFYKFNSPKGSGIGLYLIKKLMKKNGGKFLIKASPNLVFTLTFEKESP
jgi:signal transduction histidine kinase